MTVVQDEGVGAVVDGQHRLGAAWLLAKEDSLPEALQGILVDVRPSTSDDDAKKLFAEINLSEPVPLVDRPTEDGASDDLRAAVRYGGGNTSKEVAGHVPGRRGRADRPI